MEGFEGEGKAFYRCVLCGKVVSEWDIQDATCCIRCMGRKLKPTELSLWEKLVQIAKHPMFWKWGTP